MDEFLGIVKLFAGSFAPKGWAFCDGSILQVNQNAALFSLLGTTYGGNGTTTFALPDLRGRVPMGAGNGLGLSPRVAGQVLGAENVTLTTQQMPAHTHNLAVSSAPATTNTPVSGVAAVASYTDDNGNAYPVNTYGATANAPANPAAITVAGGSQPFGIVQPSLAMNYIICIAGIYPSRP